ncbi:MAG: D-alanine--D-alanine ligase [Pseudomonadota bacterium]|nr:D-alanine--D-alanine ligase [Pseudomonadota bacterium]
MPRLRILVLVHETLVPPESLDGVREQDAAEYRTEFDVISCLRECGHEVRPMGIGDSLTELRTALADWRPQICFNLLEEFDGIVTYDQHIVAWLELLRQPYTGCNPRGMMLSRDKVLSKQLLAYHRIPTPQFAVFARGRAIRIPARMRYPLFVKSATEDASLGISQASIVDDAARLRERIAFIHEHTSSDALVEEYVEGREFYVGVIGNDRIRTLPPWEFIFGELKAGRAGIATRKAKWDRAYQARHGITSDVARDLPEGLAARLDKLARRIYRALHMTGYARMDFRVRADGTTYFLEANANPNVEKEEDFAYAALAGGMDYAALLQRLIALGLSYRAKWRQD